MKMAGSRWRDFDRQRLSGRNRRLLHEWSRLEQFLAGREEIDYSVTERNAMGLPTGYRIDYRIPSICGVEHLDRLNDPDICNPPIFASAFRMGIHIPENYPCIDAPATFRFWVKDENGNSIPHPWHPNIRFFGEFAGRVCLNTPDSYMDLAWCVDRVALYLRYDLYHAIQEPPYPEDPKVAEWVVRQGEPNGWFPPSD